MIMSTLDWLVVCVPVVLVALVALRTRKYTRSVADFMAAIRCAGRYLVATAQGEASYGAANVIAQFELFFLAGFTYAWWLTFNNIVWLFILLSGFIMDRYRESRVMTLAQFFEIRYAKSFRIFTGILVFAFGDRVKINQRHGGKLCHTHGYVCSGFALPVGNSYTPHLRAERTAGNIFLLRKHRSTYCCTKTETIEQRSHTNDKIIQMMMIANF